MNEALKPIPVTDPSKHPFRFWLRCLLDLQLLTIHRFRKPRLHEFSGACHDVGAGEAPWRCLLGPSATYLGLDTCEANEFGMHKQNDVIYYNGGTFPFGDASFDNLLCIEVLEHVPDPVAFISELARVIRPGGTLVLTIPWSARLHHVPHDYTRFTPYALERLFTHAGFSPVKIEPRGNDFAAMANKMVVATIRLFHPKRHAWLILTLPAALLFGPLTCLALLLAHVSMLIGAGSPDDPFGYGLAAKRVPV